ncbi:MAG TPA: thiamine-phosphate kinase, partial [Arenibaculum sp.]|nr:thiamine-phosphate kinase [Arenibaculum sp.]
MSGNGTEDAGSTGANLGEFGRIARYFRPLSSGFPGALDLVDDAALLDVPADRELVVTMDALVEGVHFLPGDPPADLAVKVLGVNVSDLAAMAADPYCYTLAIALPRERGDAWLAAFADGLARAQRIFGIVLAGGDSVSTPGPLSLTVMASGTVPRGRALKRGGGRAGDHVYVSG